MKSSALISKFILLVGSIWIFSCSSSTETRIQYPKGPNIVWIVNEDMSPEHLGAYGGTGGKTPFLDQFAKESRRYTNAFSTAGVCAPSRAAIITGSYQTAIGAHHMRTSGMSASALEFYPPNFKPYSVVVPDGMKGFPEYLRMIGYYTTNNSKEDYQFVAPKTMWDESSNKAHWKNRPDPDQPFFSIFNLTISHESQVWARENEPLLVDPDSVTVPPVYPDDSISRRTIARFITNVMRMDTQVGEIIQELKDAGLYDNTIIFYYSDHGDGMPYFKRELYDRGLKIPLMIKAPFLEPGSVSNELVSFVDFGPTVMSLTGIKIMATMQGQAFLGPQKSAPRKYVYAARDRMDSEYDRVRAVSDGRFKYIRNYMPNKPNYQNIQYRLNNPLMVHLLDLHEQGKLTPDQERWFDETKPKEELYDTQTDPWEFNNLAGNPEYEAKLQEMREAHISWVNYFGDLGAIPEMQMVEEWWGGNKIAPTTEPPVILFEDGLVALKSSTPSASIGYRKSTSDVWSVYVKPFQWNEGDSLYVQAHRIGFEPYTREVLLKPGKN